MQRRRFIQTVGTVSVSSIGIVSSGSASEDGYRGYSGIDIDIADHLSKGEFEKAKKIADNHNLQYTTTKEVLDITEGDVSTNSFDRNETSLHLSVVESYDGDDLWLTSAYGTLTGNQNTSIQQGTHHVADGFGIYFDSSEWSAPNPDPDTVTTTIDWDGPILPKDDYSIDVAEYDPNYGVAAEVHLPEQWANDDTSTLTVNIQDRFTRVDTGNDDIAIQSRYHHTYANTSALSSVSIGIGPIGFSVDVDDGGDLWEPLYLTAAPGESDST